MMFLASFTASASATLLLQPYGATNAALPPVDSANPDLCLINQGSGPVYLNFAANAPAGSTVSGNVVVPGQSTVLLTANAATLAAMVANPLVIGGPQAGVAATSSIVSGASHQMPSTVTAIRGKAVTLTVWQG